MFSRVLIAGDEEGGGHDQLRGGVRPQASLRTFQAGPEGAEAPDQQTSPEFSAGGEDEGPGI